MNNSKKMAGLRALSDAQLVERVLARGVDEDQAFGELVSRHQEALLRHCTQRLGNADDAADAVQETLLSAYRFLPNFRGEAGIRTWLFRIADNQVNNLRRKSARYTSCEDFGELVDLSAAAEGSARTGSSSGKEVRQTLCRLPQPARDILQLRFDLEMPLNDISELLGISLSASKMRLYRALEQFELRYRSATWEQVA